MKSLFVLIATLTLVMPITSHTLFAQSSIKKFLLRKSCTHPAIPLTPIAMAKSSENKPLFSEKEQEDLTKLQTIATSKKKDSPIPLSNILQFIGRKTKEEGQRETE